MGQCGLGSRTQAEPTPRRVETLSEEALELSLGTFHSLVRTKEGRVYAAGANNYGQVGSETDNRAYTPTQDSPATSFVLLESLSKRGISKVSAGANHSAALASDGVLYTWGWGKFGQLGREMVNGRQYSAVPTAIEGPTVVDVEAGYDCLMVARAEAGHLPWHGVRDAVFGWWGHVAGMTLGEVAGLW